MSHIPTGRPSTLLRACRDLNCLQTIKDPGYGHLLGIDHTHTFKCAICKKTRMHIRQSSGAVPSIVTLFDPIASIYPDVCYFCLRENAMLENGIPCGTCIAFGRFTIKYLRFIGCGCSLTTEGYQQVSKQVPKCADKFKIDALKIMNRFTIVERLVLMWLAKQKDSDFFRLPKILLRYLCKVGLPLPCPQ